MSNRQSRTYLHADIPSEIIVSNWLSPVEGFVPTEKYVDTVLWSSIDKWEDNIDIVRSTLDKDEVILAHETDVKSANDIIENGFEPEEQGGSPLRNNAVFGWVHSDDIGKFEYESSKDIDAVVFFKANRSHVYVSSFETSAIRVAIGDIDSWEYEMEHVLKYKDYRDLYKENNKSISHLKYEESSFFN